MQNEINLKLIRRQLGLTQAELAEKLGVTQAAIQKWESGVRHINGSARKLLANLVEKAQFSVE